MSILLGIKRIVSISLVFFMLSCSAEKRAAKKIDKAVSITSPDWVTGYIFTKYNVNKEINTDTIVKQDTQKIFVGIPVSRILRDTVRDTMTFYRDRVKLSVINKKDTIYLKAECKTDTVLLKEKVYVTKAQEIYEKTNEVNEWKRKFFRLRLFLIGLIIGALAFLLYRLYSKLV